MKKHLLVLTPAIFFVSLFFLLINLPSLRFFHQDEAYFIPVSKFAFSTFFIERDYSDNGWSQSYRTFGKENPQVGKYIMGFSLWLHEYKTFDGIPEWNQGEDLAWHIEQGFVPGPEELYAARLPVAVSASITATAVGLIAFIALYYLFNNLTISYLGAILSPLLLLSHPRVWLLSHRAMLDIPALFLSSTTIVFVLLSLLEHNKQHYKRSIFLSFLGAIFLGLAISTKLNTLLIGVVVVCLFAINIFIEMRHESVTKNRNWLLSWGIYIIP